MPDKRFAIAALTLGLIGLFTGGLLGCGSLVGLLLALTALLRARRSPERYGGRDVAWAAVAANGCALASLVPLAMLAMAWRSMTPLSTADDDSLPTPWTAERLEPVEPPPPPPPPPPTPRPVRKGARSEGTRDSPIDLGVAGGPIAPVRVGGAIREPRKLKHVNPVYPDIAKQARVQGVVILECTISPDGRVTDVKLLRGIPLLDQAAIEAVKQWVYTPTLLNGVPVPVIMTITVNFRLS
jgi:TonB family protein